jgi:hypothetical protein
MDSITCQNPLPQRKTIPHLLPNLIRRPLVAIPICDLVRPHDLLRTLQDRLRIDLAAIHLLAIPFLRRQLDVQPDQLVLSRNPYHRARAGAVDRTPHPDVREIGNGHDVQHALDVIRALPL